MVHHNRAPLAFSVALLLCPLLCSAAVCPSCESVISVGGVSVRVQFLSSTLVRVELRGEGHKTDKLTAYSDSL